MLTISTKCLKYHSNPSISDMYSGAPMIKRGDLEDKNNPEKLEKMANDYV